MKIATWNIQNGEEKISLKELMDSLFIDDADLIVLTGYRGVNAMQASLNSAGLNHLAISGPSSNRSQIIAASRTPILSSSRNVNSPEQVISLEINLPGQNLTLLCIHIPEIKNVLEKETFWQKIMRYAKERVNERVIIMGNFSIGEQSPETVFNFKQYFQSLSVIGWTDAWRYLHPITYEYKWFSNAKTGLKLDFIILSPPLKKLLINAYRGHYPPGQRHGLPGIPVLIVEFKK